MTRIAVRKTYKLFIGGAFPRTESGRFFSHNDASGALVAQLCRASRKDLRNAVKAARKAQPAWAGRTAFNRAQILYRAAEMMEVVPFTKVFMISAEKGKGTHDFLAWLAGEMPPGPYLFDPDDLSDMPQRLLAAEVLREKLFLNLHQELPYQLTVETESWTEREDGSAEVRCTIYIMREGHRGIILGKGGQTLGRIGKAARLELEAALERRVHLMTHVKHSKEYQRESNFVCG